MLLILLSWIYITFTCFNLGVIIDKILKLNIKDFAITVISGLFAITLFTSIWAIFFRVNWEFHLALLFVNIANLIFSKDRLLETSKQFLQEVRLLDLSFKILLGIVAILIISQCSSLPYIIDNETYYIQSIKWLNEYGFVKGLANLHPFLAQMSGWHIAQSAFTFSFLNIPFNDLSGFCLLVGNVFSITKLNAYFKNKNRLYLTVGLLPVANVFLFQFINAPSPDLPVYIITLIIIFIFIENFKNASASIFKVLALLAVFSFYIKPTSVLLLLFPLIYFIIHIRVLRYEILYVVSFGSLIILTFIIKNCLTSGYPLFPFTGFAINTDYTLPTELANFYVDLTRRYAFHLSSPEFSDISEWQLFFHWLMLPGLHGIFNKISIALLIVAPIFIYRFYNKKSVWIVYAAMCLQMICLYATSPQYRFFFNFILVFGFLFAALVFNHKRLIFPLLFLSTMLTAVTIFIPVNLSPLSKNKLMVENSTLSLSNVIFPAENSKTENKYIQEQQGSLIYYSQDNSSIFWITGNAPLPAVSREQLEYIKERYGYIPQLRGKSLNDGFYSKRVAE